MLVAFIADSVDFPCSTVTFCSNNQCFSNRNAALSHVLKFFLQIGLIFCYKSDMLLTRASAENFPGWSQWKKYRKLAKYTEK